MQALAAQTPGGNQLTVSTFGTPYILQQLRSNPQVTRELLTDINVTLKTPLPSPADFVKNLDKQFQASRAEQSFARGSYGNYGSKQAPAASSDTVASTGAFSDLEDLLDASHKLVEESVDSRARSQQASPSVTRDISHQGTEAGSRSSRFTRDQAYDLLGRTSSNVAQQASPGATGEACSPAAFEVQAFSGIQHTQPEAGVPLVMASAPGIHAQLLHNMCQRRYWDTLDIRQYLTRIDQSSRLRLEPSEGARFPGRARTLADSIQAWLDMQEENAQAFKNKLDATFIQKTKLVPKPASVMSNDSRRESSQGLIALSDSGSPAKPLARTSSSKKAVLVAR